ncbi:hypothetical protein CDL15_Pgr006062 [Punica granatum]|uniref:RING-type E3 ubiquitin transferase n=1 Tax=Punica granatum TaxID=22663 RepID=A0A218VUQ1_PUNGR|nr:hypothetical protein CDL15_Pgr006062 [Punica granatum]
MKETPKCFICQDDLETRGEAKGMPCKHKFHSRCIFPLLELHSSCRVCRFQLPAEETKFESSNGNRNNNRESERESPTVLETSNAAGDNNRGSGKKFTIPWPFMGCSHPLFSREGTQPHHPLHKNGRVVSPNIKVHCRFRVSPNIKMDCGFWVLGFGWRRHMKDGAV